MNPAVLWLLACVDNNKTSDSVHADADDSGHTDTGTEALGCTFGDSIEVAAGASHVCVRKADGSVCCDIPDDDVLIPLDYRYVALAVSDLEVCGSTGETLACVMGDHTFEAPASYTRLEAGHQDGMCGWPSAEGVWECFTAWGEPIEVPAVAFTEMAITYSGSGCGLTPDGAAQCWGDDAPEETPPVGPFVRIAATPSVACALRTDGRLTCWGADESTRDEAPTTDGWVDIDATVMDMCARREDDAGIYCWGLANGWVTFWPDDAPVADGTRFSMMDAGFWYVCGIREEDSYPQCTDR